MASEARFFASTLRMTTVVVQTVHAHSFELSGTQSNEAPVAR